MKNRKKDPAEKQLSAQTEIKVRFSEVDSMGIVWHGNYAKYFEDGRENFGKTYGIGYMDVHRHGYMIPLVKLNMDYKNQLKYEEEAILTTTFKDNPAAKIVFEYELRRKSDNKIIAIGQSIQVFLNKTYELELISPKFFEQWKSKYIK